MLESKAKYYEDVLSGKKIAGTYFKINNKWPKQSYFFLTLTLFILDEGDEEIFLVDFDKKVNDELGTKSEIEEKSENR